MNILYLLLSTLVTPSPLLFFLFLNWWIEAEIMESFLFSFATDLFFLPQISKFTKLLIITDHRLKFLKQWINWFFFVSKKFLSNVFQILQFFFLNPSFEIFLNLWKCNTWKRNSMNFQNYHSKKSQTACVSCMKKKKSIKPKSKIKFLKLAMLYLYDNVNATN